MRPPRPRPLNPRSSGFGPVVLIVGGVLLCSVFLCCGGLTFLVWNYSEKDNRRLAEAHRRWEAGQKAEAVTAYKAFLDRDSSNFPPLTERPIIYHRLIEYELGKGDTEAAKNWIEKALDSKVELAPANKTIADLEVTVRAEREQRVAQDRANRGAAERRRQEDQKAATARWKAEEDRKREANKLHNSLAGEWNCTSEISGGETVQPGYHKKWTIRGERLTINDERELWYRLDENATPPQLHIYNNVGGRTVSVYACIFKFEGDKLIVCLEAASTPPAHFNANRNDTSFLLTFTK